MFLIDVNTIVKELNVFVQNILEKNTSVSVLDGILDITFNVTSSNLLSDQENSYRKSQPMFPHPQIPPSEPLVDVYESHDKVKIIAVLPGIRKDDVKYYIRNGFIEVAVVVNQRPFVTSIPCNVTPSSIEKKSSTYNNSVLEITFKKNT